jgi:hypothetical protein
MLTVILSHEVNNFEEWKKGFDSNEEMRTKAGIVLKGVFSNIGNDNHVTIMTEFPSKEVFDGFMSNPDLQSDMAKAGVIGKPEVKVLNKVQ